MKISHGLVCAPALLVLAMQAASAQKLSPIPPVLSLTVLPNVRQNPAVIGRDGTYSTEIDGKSYWAFNDTALSQANASGENFFSNSLSWSSSLDASHGIFLDNDQVDSSGLPAQFIPFSTRETVFDFIHDPAHCSTKDCGESLAVWPAAVVYNPANRQVVIGFGLIVRGGPISGFKGVGSGVSVGSVLPNGELSMTRPVQGPTGSADRSLLWSLGQQAYSPMFIRDGYYYCYGGFNVFVTTHEVLARVPVDRLLQISAWTYYAGNETWSTNPADAKAIVDGGSSGSSFFFDVFLNEWVTIYSANFSNDIYYAVAAAPEGPWSKATLLYTGLPGADGNNDYAARAHPEYSPDGGMTEYVSYVHDVPGFLAQDLPLLKIVFGRPQ